MASVKARPRLVRTRGRGGRRSRSRGNWVLVPAFVVAGMIGGVLLGSLPGAGISGLLEATPATSTPVLAGRTFPTCDGGRRMTCVVDGDTFWLDGIKIRIADINTPEVSQPRCAPEAALGRRATARLAELLNDGPFTLKRADRDEDRYGRKLRIVERRGRSIGDVLVAEGLAHHWQGDQQNWC